MAEFAWGILEMGDRAYDVSCRFGGTQIDTLEFNMQVPNISPNTVTSSPITFSSCNMKIVQGRNPLVTSVNVLDLGDIATLVFWVDNQGVFDLSVFDCYAHDGMQMSRLELVDEAGCPAHKKVIGFTQRSTALSPGHTYVYAHFKAFKFPDIDNVFFTCQCRVCFDHCYAPDCDGNRKKREATSTSDDNKAKVVDADGREYNMGDSVDEQLMAETIYVRVPSVDSVMYDEETGEMLKLRHKAVTIGDLCVNRMTFIAGISACVVLLFFGFLAAAVCHARSRRSQKTATNTVDNFGFAGKF
ncbi:PREDICTED: uncharacterized protein LOC106807581 [Priapulus caudatus]|uniref:Uncharacterized protein LOC106807581 n=1 Tax=Priapulus caudatus TaxID=37621 RepID=A0ABM1DZS5_PRICU|nr:PREDICTED: uncharacterized protein LOC106807581 [Priapulus caudatus]